MSYSIEIEQLHKHYPGAEFPSLQGLSLHFKKGIIAGLLGPNGAGKTTTISIICGLVKQDDGRVTVLGLDNKADTLQIKQKIGVVPQQIALYPQLSARENLEYIGKLYKIPGKELKESVEQYLIEFGLINHANKKVGAYSGGMKRRANIIAGILHNPEILILDEPTSGVDVQSRNMILEFITRYNQSNKTVVYTSHLLEEAEKICHEVAIIDQGKLIAHDTTQNLINGTKDCHNLEEVFLYHTGRTVRE